MGFVFNLSYDERKAMGGNEQLTTNRGEEQEALASKLRDAMLI